ncbi:MAG: hypothetical protein ACUVQH_10880 [Thermogutta sp.]
MKKLQPPAASGEFLVVPPISSLVEVAQANVSCLAACPRDLGGVPRAQLACQARKELLQAALQWTQRYDESATIPKYSDDQFPTIYMTGHQPELFHPGVWFKNAVLQQAARNANAVAIFLVVDNDVMKSSFVRIPTGNRAHPQVVSVPLDGGPPGVPYEDRTICDRDMFASFGKRVKSHLTGIINNALIDDFWPIVQQHAKTTRYLGDAITRGRHWYEKRWGWNILEVPQSVLCEQTSFLRLVLQVWLECERFREIHNRAIFAYRRLHRLRSKSHPFPELQRFDDWCEIPFWTWTVGEPTRRRIFLRRAGCRWKISDGATWNKEIPTMAVDSFDTFVNWWRDQAKQGRRVRSRAVITTLWARLCLSDLFIHGIGGAKYDQVTDEIIRGFFQCPPPVYATATATLQLPVVQPRVEPQDIARLRQLMRDLEFHPERCIDLEQLASPQREAAKRMIEEKWRWIQKAVTSSPDARQRFLALRECNSFLRTFVAADREKLQQLLENLLERFASQRILTSRDWPFCIYPASQFDELFGSLEESSVAR